MAASARPAFVHRNNPDGTTDSICGQCFATVCTSIWEAKLERAEQDHVCDPDALHLRDTYARGQAERTKKPAS
jgi:hypothetical protein